MNLTRIVFICSSPSCITADPQGSLSMTMNNPNPILSAALSNCYNNHCWILEGRKKHASDISLKQGPWSLNRLRSTPGAEQDLAWRKLSASEKPWRQIRAMVAVSGGISTEEIRIKFSVDTDTKVFEMLTLKCTSRFQSMYSFDHLYPKRIRVLRADVSPASEGGDCDRVTVKPGEVVTASTISKKSKWKHDKRHLDWFRYLLYQWPSLPDILEAAIQTPQE